MTNKNAKRVALPGLALLIMTSLSVSAQKKVIKISTKKEILATKSEVYEVLIHLNRFPEWSPFVVTDPSQENFVTGEDGKIGATFHWKGVAEKSEGIQKLASKENEKYVKMTCEIYKPFKGFPVFEYSLTDNGESVNLIQDFTLQLNGFSYFMTKVFGVEKKMQESNELGMSRLKKLLETN